jgi:membrane-associated phospholipid phosphatase
MLGDSRLLLPMAAVLLFAGWRVGTVWHVRWAMALMVVGLVVLASKLAFLGWGIGVASLDFTGFSGHAAMSAVVWPMAAFIAATTHRAGKWAAMLGFALAAAVGYSRIPLNAHSWSEVVSGGLLGAVASAWALDATSTSARRLNAGWAALALAIGCCMPVLFPQVRTHHIVVQMATALSGAAKAFDRSALHGEK